MNTIHINYRKWRSEGKCVKGKSVYVFLGAVCELTAWMLPCLDCMCVFVCAWSPPPRRNPITSFSRSLPKCPQFSLSLSLSLSLFKPPYSPSSPPPSLFSPSLSLSRSVSQSQRTISIPHSLSHSSSLSVLSMKGLGVLGPLPLPFPSSISLSSSSSSSPSPPLSRLALSTVSLEDEKEKEQEKEEEEREGRKWRWGHAARRISPSPSPSLLPGHRSALWIGASGSFTGTCHGFLYPPYPLLPASLFPPLPPVAGGEEMEGQREGCMHVDIMDGRAGSIR